MCPFRAGDTIRLPNGEHWVLVCDQVCDEVVLVGYPPRAIPADECALVRSASDRERAKMLRTVTNLGVPR